MIVMFVYERNERSAKALANLVTAVARARSEGMFVEVSCQNACSAVEGEPVPSVFVEGVRAAGTAATEIYEAIARAHRRPTLAPVTDVPSARVETRRRS